MNHGGDSMKKSSLFSSKRYHYTHTHVARYKGSYADRHLLLCLIWFRSYETVLTLVLYCVSLLLELCSVIFTFTRCLSPACPTWTVFGYWVCLREISSFQGIASALLELPTLKLKLDHNIKVCDTLDVAHLSSEGFCTKYRSSFELLMASYSLLNIKDSIAARKMFS